MKRCKLMVEVGRRQFLRGTAVTAAGAAAVAAVSGAAKEARAAGAISYPGKKLANIKDLEVNVPFEVAYPDDDAPGVLLKMGHAVDGGVGPDGDIVGFSTVCPHKGFPLHYVAEDRTFNCPGHYSRFDAEKGGLQIWGQATMNLPQYELRIDENGDIWATGVDELLYGRLSNVLA